MAQDHVEAPSDPNFFLDIKILYLTVMKVISREGITQEGSVTSNKFEGNEGFKE